MNLIVMFAPFFLELPLAICQTICAKNKTVRIFAVSTGSDDIKHFLKNQDRVSFEEVVHLPDLESDWLKSAVNEEAYSDYESALGLEAVNRLLISDRQVGRALIFDAETTTTPLSKISINDQYRSRYIGGLLSAIDMIFSNFRPNIVFCYTVAGAQASAFANICKLRQVKFLRLSATHLEDYYCIDSTAELSLQCVNETFFKIKNGLPVSKDVRNEARAILNEFQNKPRKYKAAAKNHQRTINSLRIKSILSRLYHDAHFVFSCWLRDLPVSFRKASPVQNLFYNFSTSMRGRAALKDNVFRKIGSIPKDRFIFFPLQVTPEASTMVLAPMHTNQYALVENLAKSLPSNVKLVVKEHIPMVGKRPRWYYKALGDMPNVILVSPFENNFSLIKKCEFVCTITGTAAWEGLLLGKRAMLIGRPHFSVIEHGVICEDNLSKLPNAVLETLTSEKPDNNELAQYIAAILMESFQLPAELYRTGVTRNTVSKHSKVVEKIADKIIFASKRARSKR